MDAVEFLKEQKRMCDSYDSCFKCKLSGKCKIHEMEFDKMKDAVSIVEEWSKEHQHPVKTNRDVLIDLVKEHFGSGYGWHSNGLDDSIKFNFTNGFLDEEYKGKSALSFEEARELLAEMCNDMGVFKSCVFFNKTNLGCNGCKKWCFDHPQEAQEILLKWKCGKQNDK